MLRFGFLDESIRLRRWFFIKDSIGIPATHLRYCYEKQIIKSTGSDIVRDLMMQEVTIKVALLMRTR
jgi:hypothetical protein